MNRKAELTWLDDEVFTPKICKWKRILTIIWIMILIIRWVCRYTLLQCISRNGESGQDDLKISYGNNIFSNYLDISVQTLGISSLSCNIWVHRIHAMINYQVLDSFVTQAVVRPSILRHNVGNRKYPLINQIH